MGEVRVDFGALLLIMWAVGSSGAVEQKEILNCRCEYPLEAVYTDPLSAQMHVSPAFPYLTYDMIENFVLDEGVLIIPYDHEACRHVQFVCDSSYARFPLWEGKCQIHPNKRQPPNTFMKKGTNKGIDSSMAPPSRRKSGKGMIGMMKKATRVVIPSPQFAPLRGVKSMGVMTGKKSSKNKKSIHKFNHTYQVQIRGKSTMKTKTMMKKKGSRRKLLEKHGPIETQVVVEFEEEVQYRQQNWYTHWGEPWRAVVLPSNHPYCVARDANLPVIGRYPTPAAPAPGMDPMPSIDGSRPQPSGLPIKAPIAEPT